MNLTEIKQLARDRGIAPGKLRKTELIHSLQAQEVSSECYNTNHAQVCGQPNCLWRSDCQ